jgi:hypothetical protein
MIPESRRIGPRHWCADPNACVVFSACGGVATFFSTLCGFDLSQPIVSDIWTCKDGEGAQVVTGSRTIQVGVGRIDGVQNGGSTGNPLGGKEEEAIPPFLLSPVEESYWQLHFSSENITNNGSTRRGQVHRHLWLHTIQ